MTENTESLREAARRRIDQQTKTAGVAYELLHAEVAVRWGEEGQPVPFRDRDVHRMLTGSGVERMRFPQGKGLSEWFRTGLDTVREAIRAVKEGKNVMAVGVGDSDPIVFRPEQRDAIERTCRLLRKRKRMLWNAKMRFGKTLCALEVVRRCGYRRTIILTHRPVVSDGWFGDFRKIFGDGGVEYHFGSRLRGRYSLEELVRSDAPFVYFASLQDLRGSASVGGDFDKNELAFQTEWDCVIIDEAHEGTKTALGEKVLRAIVKPESRELHLSGTPFNLQEEFGEEETYTWDYADEQKAKVAWETERGFEPNPYADLPRLNILTYDLNDDLAGYEDVRDSAFNFREFFRVWTGEEQRDGGPMPQEVKPGDFVHREDVRRFLDLMSRPSERTNYPYSTEEFRNNFKHTLWMLPGVREAKALKQLMEEHEVFGCGDFRIVNVAGDGTKDEPEDNALDAVRSAIASSRQPEAPAYTITLSCGRLTTGVTVKEWTAVFMLSGSATTSAAGYLQTIFRVQSPGSIDGKVKTDCYAFDFAPDRALVMVAEAAEMGKTDETPTESTQRQRLSDFINFCPVIAMKGSSMQCYSVDRLLQYLKRAYVERVVRSGFEDKRLYNDRLLRLQEVQLEDFEELRKIVGTTKQSVGTEKININSQGLNNEEYEKVIGTERKHTTLEERELREKLKKSREMRDKVVTILRSISIRIPLLIYGADVPFDENVTPESITELVDDISWQEFMPQGVSKELYRKFTSYYDRDIFVAAGRRIRELARQADELPPLGRVKRIAELFAFFRNPDRETVLTPWRVVNMQLSKCLGGWDFFDENHRSALEQPRPVAFEDVTSKVFCPTSRFCEFNAKTGLYSLYVTYSIMRARCDKVYDVEVERAMWDQTLAENIFVLCRTKMASRIVQRTLCGYGSGKIKCRVVEDIIEELRKQKTPFKYNINSSAFWGLQENNDMKFTAIIGNPPYQVLDGSGGAGDSAVPVYNHFVTLAKALNPEYISLIMPSKWMVGGRGLQGFRQGMCGDTSLRLLTDFEDDAEVFSGIHIDGGVCYFLWDAAYHGKPEISYHAKNGEVLVSRNSLQNDFFDYAVRDHRIISVLEKTSRQSKNFAAIVSRQKPYGIRAYLFNSPERYPESHLSSTPFEGSVKVYGVKGIKGGARRTQGYISLQTIKRNHSHIDLYKIFFSKCYSTGAMDPPAPILAQPKEICTETFLEIGPFDTKVEQQNCYSYTQTTFFKFLLFYGKGTMNVSASVFKLVPMQDFTIHSDIIWNTAVEEIDRQLFAKYKLNAQEQAFIEKTVKKM